MPHCRKLEIIQINMRLLVDLLPLHYQLRLAYLNVPSRQLKRNTLVSQSIHFFLSTIY